MARSVSRDDGQSFFPSNQPIWTNFKYYQDLVDYQNDLTPIAYRGL